ncbi:hypothetical protein [Phocaeicola oris]|nr:hypothetical protein [Phocaeicola oris]
MKKTVKRKGDYVSPQCEIHDMELQNLIATSVGDYGPGEELNP